MENDAKMKIKMVSDINIPEESYSSPISSTTSGASNSDAVSSRDSPSESSVIKERRKKFVKKGKIICDPKGNNACTKIPSIECKIDAASNDVHKDSHKISFGKSSSQSDSDSTTDTSSSSDNNSSDNNSTDNHSSEETESDSTELISTSLSNSTVSSSNSENETINYTDHSKVEEDACIDKQMENIKIESHSP